MFDFRFLGKGMVVFLFVFSFIFFLGCSFNGVGCGDEKVELEGVFKVSSDKYEIATIETESGVYWIYDSDRWFTARFYENLNKSVRIEGYLSRFDYDNADCSICMRMCEDGMCQCPSVDLLYDVKVLEVLDSVDEVVEGVVITVSSGYDEFSEEIDVGRVSLPVESGELACELFDLAMQKTSSDFDNAVYKSSSVLYTCLYSEDEGEYWSVMSSGIGCLGCSAQVSKEDGVIAGVRCYVANTCDE